MGCFSHILSVGAIPLEDMFYASRKCEMGGSGQSIVYKMPCTWGVLAGCRKALVDTTSS